MMDHDVLMSLGVGKLESASFQSPEETSPIHQDRVETEPAFVLWWRCGIVGLRLSLETRQTCDMSSNVGHLLDDRESEREAEAL